MDEAAVRQYVKKQIAYLKEDTVEASAVKDDQPLFAEDSDVESMGLDSLDAAELSMALDSEFDLGAPGDVDLRQFRTVNDIVAFVMGALSGEPTASAVGVDEAGA